MIKTDGQFDPAKWRTAVERFKQERGALAEYFGPKERPVTDEEYDRFGRWLDGQLAAGRDFSSNPGRPSTVFII